MVNQPLIIAGQVLIGIGYAIFIISRFLNIKKNMLLMDNIGRIVDIIGYALFGNINGIEHTVFGIIRNEAYRRIKRKITKTIVFISLLAVIGIMYGFAFSGISTVLFIASNILNLVGTAYGNEQGVRLGTVGACCCNVPAFLMIGNYAGLTGEVICFGMTVAAIIKYKNAVFNQESFTEGGIKSGNRDTYRD